MSVLQGHAVWHILAMAVVPLLISRVVHRNARHPPTLRRCRTEPLVDLPSDGGESSTA